LTDRYAVVGNPIAHSKSPQIHRLFAEQLNDDISYDKELIELGNFDAWVDKFFQAGGKGLNVTLPFKADAYSYAHKNTERAERAGAVNTLGIENGSVIGDNTDGFGLLEDLTQRLGWQVAGSEVLLLGAGGAVRGVLGPLLDAMPQSITLANRTYSKAEQLAQTFASVGNIEAAELSALGGRKFDLIINGTSAGVSGEAPDLPATLFKSNACSYDMFYSAEPTPFLKWSAPLAAEISDGLGMLVAQAAESFRIWRGKRPDFTPVVELIRSTI